MPTEAEKARAYIRAVLSPDTAALAQALADGTADAYASAALALTQEAGLQPVRGLAAAYGPDLAEGWADWEAGSVDAALLLDAGAGDFLDGTLVRAAGITDTTLDRLGSILSEGAARGLGPDEIAGMMSDFLDDPVRAYMIANTELNRAMTLASLDSYAESGVTQWDWVLSPGACPYCTDQAAANPHGLGDPAPPGHPHCRCATAPRDFGA